MSKYTWCLTLALSCVVFGILYGCKQSAPPASGQRAGRPARQFPPQPDKVVKQDSSVASAGAGQVSGRKKSTEKTVNLALNRPYRMSTPPNYGLCTDFGDKTQLTDGIYSRGYFWAQKSTVGWQQKSVAITVDLGKVWPISGFSLNTAARKAAGVLFPGIVCVLVSDDDRQYHYLGNLAELDEGRAPDPEKFAVHKYVNTRMLAHGRYVKFFVAPAGNYFFCDEIEVFKGPEKALSSRLPGKPIDVNRAVSFCVSKHLVSSRIRRRMRLDLARVGDFAKQYHCGIGGYLAELEPQIKSYRFKAGAAAGFRAVMPLNPLHAGIFAGFGKVMRARGIKPLVLWHVRPYAALDMFCFPGGGKPDLRIRLMQDEYRAETLNITNAGNRPCEVSITVQGLPHGVLSMREVAYTGTREGSVVATALPLMRRQGSAFVTRVPVGFTRQVWFGVHATGIAPGIYNARVKLVAGVYHDEIPLRVTVSKLRFPPHPRLKNIVWDYVDSLAYGLTEDNVDASVRDMKEHFVNVAVGSRRCAGIIKSGDFDQHGKLKRALDFSRFDAWLARFPGARYYQVFMLCDHKTKFAGFMRGTPAFAAAIGEWARAWAAHARKRGLRKGQVQVHFLDEPHSALQFETLRDWARPFSKAVDFIDIFNDPTVKADPRKMPNMAEALSYVDVLCPLLQHVRDNVGLYDYYQGWRKQGKELWFYMCSGPNRHFDPAYFRLQPWHCFRAGAVGSGFWAYADTGGIADCWNSYAATGRGNFSPVFLTPSDTTTSKHWEAFREGVEDYEYLRMLKDAVQLSKAKKTPAWKRARALLDSITRTTLKKAVGSKGSVAYWNSWHPDSPCAAAESGRLMVLDVLEALNAER